VTDNKTRVLYQAIIPFDKLPMPVHLAGNLSEILGVSVGVERSERVTDTLSNITLYAFTNTSGSVDLMSKSDLLS